MQYGPYYLTSPCVCVDIYIYIYKTTSPCVCVDRKKERNEVTATIYFSPVALSLITALHQERRHIVLALLKFKLIL